MRLTFADYKYRENYSLPRIKVLSKSDYYPFGMLMPDKIYQDNTTKTRFGFNGMERDDEIAGVGNSYTAMFWQYDSRTARRWNQDPVDMYSMSRYATFANNPIAFTDPFGDEVDTEQLQDKDDEGDFKHKQALQAFEAILHTEEGKQWWLDRAAKGQVYEFQIYKDEDLVAEEDGQIHKAGIDYTFQVDPCAKDPYCNVPKLGEDGRLRIYPTLHISGKYFNDKERYYMCIMSAAESWIHEFGYHGSLYEKAKIAYDKGDKTMKWVLSDGNTERHIYTIAEIWNRKYNSSIIAGAHCVGYDYYGFKNDWFTIPYTFFGQKGYKVLMQIVDYYKVMYNVDYTVERMKLQMRKGMDTHDHDKLEGTRFMDMNAEQFYEEKVYHDK